MTPAQLLDRHITGDWGVLDGEDIDENELALRQGLRLMSNYPVCDCADDACELHRVWCALELL